jgi:dihydrofolate reductase
MKATVFVGTSLDGFIARAGDELDFLSAGSDAGTVDYGFREFMDSVDALAMGRNTFDVVRSFGEWPYGTKPVIVLTNRPLDIPPSLAATVESMSGSPHEIVRRLSDRGVRHLYVDGGRTIQSFLANGLITRLVISRVPILIGSGISLFGPLPHDIRLRHVATRTYEGGMVQSEYDIVSPLEDHRIIPAVESAVNLSSASVEPAWW